MNYSMNLYSLETQLVQNYLSIQNLPRIWLFLVVFFRNFDCISKLEQFFLFTYRGISVYHDFRQKWGHNVNGWIKLGKNLPKSCQNLLIFLNKMH